MAEARPVRVGVAFSGLATVMLLGALDQTIISTALPTVVGELDGVEHLAWVGTAYILTATIAMPVTGKVGDLVGRKPVLAVGIALFMLGSLLSAVAPSMAILIAGRAVQGLGGGSLMISAQALVADLVPREKLPAYMAPLGLAFGASTVVGPLLGGWFTDGPGWRWAFWINLPLSAAAFLICLATIPAARPRHATRPSIDGAGIGLVSVAVTATVLVATWGGVRYDWLSPAILVLALASVLSWIAFFVRQQHAAEPLMPLGLFRIRTFTLVTVIGAIGAGIGMVGLVSYMPTYFQMVHGLDATESGLTLGLIVVGLLCTLVVSGRIVVRTANYRTPVSLGMAILVVVAIRMAAMDGDTSLVDACSNLFLIGLGLGLFAQNVVVAAQQACPPSEVGTATAATAFFREIGATLGVAVIGAVFTARLGDRLLGAVPDPSSLTPEVARGLPESARAAVAAAYQQSLSPVFLALAVLFAIGLVLALMLPRRLEVAGAEAPAVTSVGAAS